MTFKLAEELQRVGVATPLAIEYGKQAEAGVGNVNRLIWSGVAVELAKRVAAMISAQNIDAPKLSLLGMPYPVIRTLEQFFESAPVAARNPVISGDEVVGSVLAMEPAVWDSSSPIASVARSWRRGVSIISGATGQDYELTEADIGAIITGAETATNSAGATTAVSNGIGPIVAVAQGPT